MERNKTQSEYPSLFGQFGTQVNLSQTRKGGNLLHDSTWTDHNAATSEHPVNHPYSNLWSKYMKFVVKNGRFRKKKVSNVTLPGKPISLDYP